MGYETANIIINEGLEKLRKYYSVYRGIVVNQEDPNHCNRIQVCVPEVMGGAIGWAYPRGQHGSHGDGFKYITPKVGDIVFVTFEFGDPTKPLWEFHGWGLEQIPSVLDGVNKCGLVTPEGNHIVIDDEDGSLTVHLNGNVTIDADGRVLVNSDTDVLINAEDSIILNQGQHQGIVNIIEMTAKLNQLVTELEVLRNMFNTHVHTGVTTGPGSCGPTPTQITQPFSQFVQNDYEDTKVIH